MKGTVLYLDEKDKIATFDGEFLWSPDDRILALAEKDKVVIYSDECFLKAVMERKDFEKSHRIR